MKTISLHLPDDLHAQVKAAAENDRRSAHGELLWLIERGLAERDATAPTETRGAK
jgi:hypothetical protein